MNETDTLLYWVREREAIRKRKEEDRTPPPYTDDAILSTYRFCNVRREDDRVTRWIEDHIRWPYRDHPDLWFMLAIARAINWPPTLNMLMGDPEAQPFDRIYPSAWPDTELFTPEGLGHALEDMASTGQKVFTGAYVITAPQTKGMKKTTFVANETLGDLWKDRAKIRWHLGRMPTMRSTHAELMRHNGWGPFMAYQVVVDMRFTNILKDASDVGTWAAAGPGTVRGLNRLASRPVGWALTQWTALEEMRMLYPIIQETSVGIDFSDVPNVLCEVDKYIRVRNKEGAPRALYVPGRGS